MVVLLVMSLFFNIFDGRNVMDEKQRIKMSGTIIRQVSEEFSASTVYTEKLSHHILFKSQGKHDHEGIGITQLMSIDSRKKFFFIGF